MKFRTQTRGFPILDTRAVISSVNAERRTVDVTFSTGAKVLRNSYFDGPSYEELSMDPKHVRMDRLNKGAPFLKDHRGNLDNVIGRVEVANLANGKGTATVRFAKAEDDPEADKIFRKVKDGIITSVSVGYRTYRSEKVEGGDAKIPTFRATDWEPYEISAVALPADADAQFRSDDTQLNQCVFVTRDEENNVNEEELKAQAEKLAAQKRDAEAKALADKELTERATRLERERVSGIQTAVRAAKLDNAMADRLVSDGTALDAARALVITALAARTNEVKTEPHVAIEVGEEDTDKWIRGASAAILHRAGVGPMLAQVTANVAKSRIPGVAHEFKDFDAHDTGGSFREMTLVEMARESLERQGIKTRGMTKERAVGMALTHIRSGEATTSDFAVLLENVLYKTMLGAYAQQADSWRRFCGTDSVQDFRPSNRYRTGSFGVLDTIGESAEYKQKSIPDGLKFAIATETRGNLIAISRQAIINDDMGAILDTVNKFGRSAGLSIEKAVYDVLAQNSGLGPNVTLGGLTHPLFDAAWGNIGTPAALSMASVEADRVLMASQKDISNNEFLDLRPSSLLVPLTLEGEANQLNRAKFDPTSGAAFEAPNIVGGLFGDVVGTPRLTGTRRYMFTDAGQAAALLVVFLNGSQAPFMEQQMGWRVDGTEMKVRLDFKAQAFDPKGALTNAGA